MEITIDGKRAVLVPGGCKGCAMNKKYDDCGAACELIDFDQLHFEFIDVPQESENLTKREKIALAVLPTIDTGSIETDVQKSLSYADVFLKLSKETNK